MYMLLCLCATHAVSCWCGYMTVWPQYLSTLVHSRCSLVCSHFAPTLLRHCYCTLLLYADVIILCCCLVMCLTIILCDGMMILCSLSCWLSVSFFILVLYSSILSHRLRSIVWTLFFSSHLTYILYQLYSTIGTYISYLTLTYFAPPPFRYNRYNHYNVLLSGLLFYSNR